MLMRAHTTATLASLAALIGCTAPPTSYDARLASEPLVCQGTEQCTLFWRRAQLWVVQNSVYKLQLATDVVLQTYSPSEASPQRAFTITREPLADGRERVWIRSYCRNMFGCSESAETAAASFKRYVRAGSP